MCKELNCMNCCIGDFKESLCDCDNGICKEYKKVGTAEDFENEVLNRTKPKTGKWIIRDNPGTGWYRVTCSECGEDVTSTAPCIGFFPNAKVTWDYCPNCGARMDTE